MPVNIDSIDHFIEKVYDILLDEGQNDDKFEWGEVIKFKPSEVREVLFRRKDEFKS